MSNESCAPMEPRPISGVRGFRRDPERAIVSGLCAGIARDSGYDVILIRTLAVVAGLSSGIGLVLYAGLSAISPSGENDEVPLDRYWPSWRQLSDSTITLLGIISSLIFAATLGSVTPFGWGALVIILLAVLVARRTQNKPDKRAFHYQPSTSLPPGIAWLPPSAAYPKPGQRFHTVPQWQVYGQPHNYTALPSSPGRGFSEPITTPSPPLDAQSSDPAMAAPQRKGIGHHIYVWTTLALALTGWLCVYYSFSGTTRFMLANTTALFIVAIGLIVGTKLGRSTLLILTGIGLSIAVMAPYLFLRINLAPSTATIQYHYQTASDLPKGTLTFDETSATLDFSSLALTDKATMDVTASSSIVHIIVPKDPDTLFTVKTRSSASIVKSDQSIHVLSPGESEWKSSTEERHFPHSLTLTVRSHETLIQVMKP